MRSLGRNAAADGDYRVQTTMTQSENQAMAARSAGIEILGMPAELDLATGDGVVEQGYAAIARPARLLLLDLGGLSFCDACGLSVFVRIANHADAAGCRFGLIAPRPPVAKILRISGLDSRMPVFATIDEHDRRIKRRHPGHGEQVAARAPSMAQ
jgi:anti-anti-sigma factor